MQHVPHSRDRITGEVRPVGEITGFPNPPIRSTWRGMVGHGPILTDRRIDELRKQGYFTNGFRDPRLLVKEGAKAKRKVKRILTEYLID